MIKVLGAFMVVCACTLLGLGKTAVLRTRVKNLDAIVAALELVRSEIARKTPLPELCRSLSDEGPPETRGFFKRLGRSLSKLGGTSFSQLWQNAVEDSSELGLSEAEINALGLLGHSLGRFDAPDQDEAISRCAEKMRGYAHRARDEWSSQGRLWIGLGAAGGLSVAIILF